MELASQMKKAATAVRITRMKAFAESEVQRAINGAKAHGRETAEIDVPADVDINMLVDYIKEFGYGTEQTGHSLTIKWDAPTR